MWFVFLSVFLSFSSTRKLFADGLDRDPVIRPHPVLGHRAVVIIRRSRRRYIRLRVRVEQLRDTEDRLRHRNQHNLRTR